MLSLSRPLASKPLDSARNWLLALSSAKKIFRDLSAVYVGLPGSTSKALEMYLTSNPFNYSV